MTHLLPSTNPNAARSDSWCRRYTVGPSLLPTSSPLGRLAYGSG